MAKKTLYQILQVGATAAPEVIKAAAEAKLAALRDGASPEIAAERTMVREALELLGDPARRKVYDDRLREERFRALSSGGGVEESRPRPANAGAARSAEPSSVGPSFTSGGWLAAVALLLAVGVGGSWVCLDHNRKLDAQRLEEARLAEETRRKEEESRLRRDTMDWAKDRIDTDRRSSDQRRQDFMRERERRQADYEARRQEQVQLQETRRKEAEGRRAQYEETRNEEENRRRAQAQAERDRRALIEAERNHRMTIPR